MEAHVLTQTLRGRKTVVSPLWFAIPKIFDISAIIIMSFAFAHTVNEEDIDFLPQSKAGGLEFSRSFGLGAASEDVIVENNGYFTTELAFGLTANLVSN